MAFILLKKVLRVWSERVKERGRERGREREEEMGGRGKMSQTGSMSTVWTDAESKKLLGWLSLFNRFCKKSCTTTYSSSASQRERESELESTRRREKVIKDKTKKKIQEKLFSKRVNIDG